jgi:AcrR family transcriptional regulator
MKSQGMQPVQMQPVQERGRKRREALVEAALQTCASVGLGALSLQGVADAAGVAKSVVLYYFHDRDGLLEALAVRAVAPWRLAHDGLGGADATVKPDEPGGDPREQLNRWLAAMFTLAVREREALRVRLAMLGEPPNAPWRTHVDACDRLALRQLALLMARGHGQYAWHAPDAARAALLVRGLVEGLSLEALRSDADTVTRLHGQCRGAVLDLLVRR